MNEKIILTFDTHEPIEIEAFCKSLLSFQDEYQSITQKSSKLLIKEIRKGSIEVELITLATATVLPLLGNINTVYQFIDYFNKTITWLSGKSKEPEETKFTIKDLENIKNILTPIAQSSNDTSRILISSTEYHDIVTIDKEIVENVNITITRKVLLEKDTANYIIPDVKQKQVLFFWYQTRFDDHEFNSGDKGLVSSIDKTPKKIIFADDSSETKHQMTTTNPMYKKDWQEVGYIVDLEIVFHENRIIAYKIIKNYPEDAIID
jgi:hypothetical protein